MEVRINLNEIVKFKLSERGKEIYRHRYDRYGFVYDREPKLDGDGCMRMQLWTFMNIFGEHMILGEPEVINPLEIIYEQEEAMTEFYKKEDVIDFLNLHCQKDMWEYQIADLNTIKVNEYADKEQAYMTGYEHGRIAGILQNKWIPVNERLPEDGYWLWSATSGEVKKDFYFKGHWEIAEELGYDVIAWMPLPEPYKGGDTE